MSVESRSVASDAATDVGMDTSVDLIKYRLPYLESELTAGSKDALLTMTSHAPSLVVASNQHQGLFVYPDPALSIASSNQRSDDVTGDDVTCDAEVAGGHAEGDQVVASQETPAVVTVTKIPDADNTQQSAIDCEVEDSIKNSPRGEGEGSACVTPPPTCQT